MCTYAPKAIAASAATPTTTPMMSPVAAASAPPPEDPPSSVDAASHESQGCGSQSATHLYVNWSNLVTSPYTSIKGMSATRWGGNRGHSPRGVPMGTSADLNLPVLVRDASEPLQVT